MTDKTTGLGSWAPKHRAVRQVLRRAIRVGFSSLSRLEIVGRENLPDGGPLIVVANHFHFADPVAVIRAVPWPLEFMGGTRMPFAPTGVKWLTHLWGTTRVRRSGSSRSALRAMERTLRQGGVVGIFPEGGSWADVLRLPRPGTAYVAARTGAPVLPIGLSGLREMFPALRKGRRAKVTVRIGAPIGPFQPADRGRAGRATLDDVGDRIMKAIAALLPAGRRGVYADDPKLRAAARQVSGYPWEKKLEET